MGYFPKSQTSISETSGNEFKVKGTPDFYTGKYVTTSENKYYVGSNPLKLGPELERIVKDNNYNQGDSFDVQMYNILHKQNKKFLTRRKYKTSIKPTPTEIDYEKGFFVRYFQKKVNENTYIEINKELYDNHSKEYDFYLNTVGALQWALIGDTRKINRKTLDNLEFQHSGISNLFFVLDEFKKIEINDNLYSEGGELYYKDGKEFIGAYHLHPIMGPIEGPVPLNIDLSAENQKRIPNRYYPDGGGDEIPIPSVLPSSYKMPTEVLKAQNQKCSNCYFFKNNVCHKWKASVRQNYWCQSYILMQNELDYANELQSSKDEEEARRNRILKKVKEELDKKGNYSQLELQLAQEAALIDAGIETPESLAIKASLENLNLDITQIKPPNLPGTPSYDTPTPPPFEPGGTVMNPTNAPIMTVDEYFKQYNIDPMERENIRLAELERRKKEKRERLKQMFGPFYRWLF